MTLLSVASLLVRTWWRLWQWQQKGPENVRYNSVTTTWWVVSIPCTAHVKAVWPRPPSLCGVLNIGAGEKKRELIPTRGLAGYIFHMHIRDEDLEKVRIVYHFISSVAQWAPRPPFCVCMLSWGKILLKFATLVNIPATFAARSPPLVGAISVRTSSERGEPIEMELGPHERMEFPCRPLECAKIAVPYARSGTQQQL